MAWFQIDDQLAFHPKVIQAGNAAMGMWVRAGAWSQAHLTGGHIPAEQVKALGGVAVAKKLVAAGLWIVDDAGVAAIGALRLPFRGRQGLAQHRHHQCGLRLCAQRLVPIAETSAPARLDRSLL